MDEGMGIGGLFLWVCSGWKYGSRDYGDRGVGLGIG